MSIDRTFVAAALCGALCSFLVGCGGGSSGGTAPPPDPGVPTIAQRRAAAESTASSATNDCARLRPFYWEIGNRDLALASGSVSSAADPTVVYTASSVMSIASASKWLYSTYFVQRTGGTLTAEDVAFLTLRSGYTNFTVCPQGSTTVQGCLQAGTNGDFTKATEGYFYYNGGHMQKHASLRGLGELDTRGLADEIRGQLGSDIQLTYVQPQIAGGVATSAEQYAKVLRKILAGQLRMQSLLGANKVCANPQTCPGEALRTPIPPGETWHYSLGHWVEDDPGVGDGAFSSAGLFGFYPWIDRTQTWYGVVAKLDVTGALDSVSCGRTIRKAWVTGTPL